MTFDILTLTKLITPKPNAHIDNEKSRRQWQEEYDALQRNLNQAEATQFEVDALRELLKVNVERVVLLEAEVARLEHKIRMDAFDEIREMEEENDS